MWGYLESLVHQLLGFLMELWGREVIRDTKARKEKRVTVVSLVLQDFLGGQDLWAQKVSPLWVLKALLVLQVNLEPLGLGGLAPVDLLALLVPQDLFLHMDQLSVFPDLLVLLGHQELQDMPTR